MSIHPTAFIHPAAFVCGTLSLGPRVSIWPMAVVRADTASITIGADTNVQDGTVIHVDRDVPTLIGERVAIGHRAIVHGATIGSNCLIGMGAIVLNHVVIGDGSVIGAGALCPEGMVVPPDSVVLGVPGRVVRQVTPDMRARMEATVRSYIDLQDQHRRGVFGPLLG